MILAISFVLAVGANLGIAGCVLRYREMRTPTNLCLVNLAAADLLFTVGVPAVAYTRLTQSWHLGETVCRLLPYSQVRSSDVYECSRRRESILCAFEPLIVRRVLLLSGDPQSLR